jgi:fatty acid amide hydrolase
VRGSELDRRLWQLLFLPSLWRPIRWAMATAFDLAGERRQARLLREARRRSAPAYWKATHRLRQFVGGFMKRLADERIDAIVCPPYALPAVLHSTAHELVPAASYAILFNVLGLPSGVVAAGRVQPGEESDRPEKGDRMERLSRRIEQGSAGLPMGVHVAAAPWREDIVLAVMGALEEAFRRKSDYPAEPPQPAIREATQSTA